MLALATVSLFVLSASAEDEERLAELEIFTSKPATQPFKSKPTSKPFHRPRRPPISGVHPGAKPFVSKPATNPFKAAGDMTPMPAMTTSMPPMTTSMPPMTTSMPAMTTTPASSGKWYNVSVGYGSGGVAFTPKTVFLMPGDWVRWIWVSDDHNVMSGTCGAPDGKFCSNTSACTQTFNTGHIMTRQFNMNGVYPYYCGPHCASGMVGSVVVGPRTFNVSVENFAFNPQNLWVHKGDTVNFQWKNDGHNVVSGSTCGNHDMKFCSDAGASCLTTTYNTGHEMAVEMGMAGEHYYFCNPHCGSSGMYGSIEVGPRWHNVSVGNGNMTFMPNSLNIKVGDWVTWTFTEGGHNIISGASCTDDGKWCCEPGNCQATHGAGWKYSKQFNFPGTFPYFCGPHCSSGMYAAVMVTEPNAV